MNENLLPDLENYKSHVKGKASPKDTAKNAKPDTSKKVKELKTAAHRNKKDTAARYLAARTK